MAEELLNQPQPEEEIEFGADKKVEESSEFELIEEGTYEVTLKTLERLKSKKLGANGLPTEYIKVTFVIRDDVDQKFKNRRVWFTIFKKDNDRAFNFNEINKIIITQEGREDYKRRFTSLDEILQYLVGLQLKLDIGIEFNEARGKDDNVLVKDSFKPSTWVAPKPEASVPVDESDDDLPF